jgi:hypothetical protein
MYFVTSRCSLFEGSLSAGKCHFSGIEESIESRFAEARDFQSGMFAKNVLYGDEAVSRRRRERKDNSKN